LFDLTQAMTGARGLPAYEVSNHAAPGAECRHNLIYWQGWDYVGIGPGAHGRRNRADGGAVASLQHKAPDRWLNATDRTAERAILSPAERRAELVMMGLRLTAGLSASRFAALTGGVALDAALDADGLATMLDEGFVAWAGECLRATAKGRLVLNSVVARLLA